MSIQEAAPGLPVQPGSWKHSYSGYPSGTVHVSQQTFCSEKSKIEITRNREPNSSSKNQDTRYSTYDVPALSIYVCCDEYLLSPSGITPCHMVGNLREDTRMTLPVVPTVDPLDERIGTSTVCYGVAWMERRLTALS